jgi:hypothetical protein
LFLFIGAKTKNLIFGPSLSITSPKDGETLTDSLITIKGKTGNIASLYLNGRKIYINEEGQFSEELLIPLGYSIIEVRAVDREKDETVRRVRVWRKE